MQRDSSLETRLLDDLRDLQAEDFVRLWQVLPAIKSVKRACDLDEEARKLFSQSNLKENSAALAVLKQITDLGKSVHEQSDKVDAQKTQDSLQALLANSIQDINLYLEPLAKLTFLKDKLDEYERDLGLIGTGVVLCVYLGSLNIFKRALTKTLEDKILLENNADLAAALAAVNEEMDEQEKIYKIKNREFHQLEREKNPSATEIREEVEEVKKKLTDLECKGKELIDRKILILNEKLFDPITIIKDNLAHQFHENLFNDLYEQSHEFNLNIFQIQLQDHIERFKKNATETINFSKDVDRYKWFALATLEQDIKENEREILSGNKDLKEIIAIWKDKILTHGPYPRITNYDAICTSSNSMRRASIRFTDLIGNVSYKDKEKVENTRRSVTDIQKFIDSYCPLEATARLKGKTI